MMEAKVIAHSISGVGKEICTMQLCYPRFIHSEFLTHRVFSRNASSSRAIPVAKMIKQVRENPAMPVHWGANQPGMQAHQELEGQDAVTAMRAWKRAANEAADTAEFMEKMGVHKQVANRILEPFQFIHVIVTATEWRNFFELRDHEDAQPEIRVLARLMRDAMKASIPRMRMDDPSQAEYWHLPYVLDEERNAMQNEPGLLIKLSGARCARVSYLTHDGTKPDVEKDLALYDRLVGGVPLHASPVEHQAHPTSSWSKSGNFVGWMQYRQVLESGYVDIVLDPATYAR